MAHCMIPYLAAHTDSLTSINSLIIIIPMITTVTGKNQITIPAKIAVAAGIQPGTRINWTLDAGGTLRGELLPSRGELARKVAGMGRPWLAPGEDPIQQLIDEREEANLDENDADTPV